MTHITDEMIIKWDVPVDMGDGLQLRADIFCPAGPGPYPVLLSHGPYAKGASFQTGYAATWNRLTNEYPEVTRNTTNKYQNFEVATPRRQPSRIARRGSALLPIQPS